MKPAGYSGTPLVKKLGFKPGFKARVINAPDYYDDLLEGLPDEVEFINNITIPKDLIHLFVQKKTDIIKSLYSLRNELKQNGMIWVSWPKKSSGIASDITEDDIRINAIQNDLVDIKVCAIDETWSGLKLVIPVKSRSKS